MLHEEKYAKIVFIERAGQERDAPLTKPFDHFNFLFQEGVRVSDRGVAIERWD